MDEVNRTPRAPRHRGRLSLSEATPPLRNPIVAVGQPGCRGGVRSRSSLSTATPPPSSVLAMPRWQDQRLSIDSPWLGERLEFPTTTASSMPATRGETTLFRRAEELWRGAAKARQESRRRSMGSPPPTLEQRLAWRREAEETKRRQRGGTPNDQRRRLDGDGGEENRSHGVSPGAAEAAAKAAVVAEEAALEAPHVRRYRGATEPSGSCGSASSGSVIPSAAGQADGAKRASASLEEGQSGENERVQQESVELDRGLVRARVLAIYEAHNPDKVGTVDAILDKYAGKWDSMLKRLEDKYVSESKLPYAAGNGPLCFMDIEIGGESVGRLVFRLFADKAPKASENFRALCTGEHGRGLRYEGSAFHRIVPGFVVQGGDFTTGDGRGGKSIYGGKFEDECFMRHHKPGLLSMANSGPNTNGSQFFIALKAIAHLDGKHVVFGELQTGIKVLDRMKSVELLEPRSEGKPAPHQRVVIARCGQLQEDGKEMPGPSAHSPLPSGGSDLVSPLNQPASQSYAPLFGRTTALGGQPRGAIFGAAPAAAGGYTAQKSIFSALGGSAGGGTGVAPSSSDDARGLGSGGLFRHGLTAPVLSFGTLPSTVATPLRGSEGAEQRTTGDSTRAGFCRPLNTSDAAAGLSTVASSFASLAAAVSAGPPAPHSAFASPGAEGASSPSAKHTTAAPGPGDSTDRARATVNPRTHEKQPAVPAAPKAAPETAFDGLDRARTGWVGHDEIEILVGRAGFSYRSEEHGLALLKLCSLRLSRESFLEWYRSEQQVENAPGASRVEDSRAGLPQAGAVTTSTAAVVTTTAENLAATAKDPSAVKKRQATEYSREGLGDEKDEGSGDDEERREERAKAEAAFDKVDDAGRGWVGEANLEALLEAVGTTHSEEDHKQKLLSICRESRLEREAFLAWYDDWLFGEDDLSDEGGEEGSEVSAAAETAGFSSHPKSAVECLSYETVKPGEVKDATNSTRSSTSFPESAFEQSLGTNKATGGFTFGTSPVLATVTKSTATASGAKDAEASLSGAPAGVPDSVSKSGSPGLGGFIFGAPVAAAAAPATNPAAPAGGTPQNQRAASQSDSDGGEDQGEDNGGNSGSANNSNDEDETDDEERQEERAKAGAAFDAVDPGAKGWVEEAQFEALMEAVGTTYSVEDHKPKLVSVCREKRLEREVFLTWYDDWLFGEDDSSDEGGEEGKRVSAAAKTEGFSSILASQASSWKCKACLVSNPESAMECLSCETVKPGEEGQEGKVPASATRSSTSAPGAASGLSLSSIKASGGFTFGSPSVPAPVTTPAAVSSGSDATGGFTFGGPPADANDTVTAGASPSTEKLCLAASAVESAPSTLKAPVTQRPAPTGGTSEDSKAAAQSNGDGSDNDGDDNDVDDEERREERSKAEAAFDQVDSTGRGWVEEAQFEALMEAVGTTYSVDDHKPKLVSICFDKRLQRQAFLTWYNDWLFGEDDSSDGGGREEKGVSVTERVEGFASLLANQARGWKCKACLVSNPESASKCLSCATVKLGEEGKLRGSASGSDSSSTRAAFGFSFDSSKTIGGITFGSSPATSATASSGSIATGGFKFGGSLAGAPETDAAAAVPSAGGFSFGAPVVAAPVSRALDLTTDPATSAYHTGEDRSAAAESGGSTRENCKADSNDENSNEDNDSVDEDERREERDKAEAAFDKIDDVGRGWVEERQFEALMEAVGTTYSAEDHKPKLVSICQENRLEREIFLTWYDDWLFGEDDSSNEGGEDGNEVGASAKTEGFSFLLASQSRGWKCRACLVPNPESSVKCMSCETVRPGKGGKVGASVAGSVHSVPSSAFGLSVGPSKATGGFTFGSSPAPKVVTRSPAASSMPKNTGGFKFGGLPAAPPDTAKSGECKLGAAVAAAPAPATDPPASAGGAAEASKTSAQSSGTGKEGGSNSGGGNDDDVDDVVDDDERGEERAKAEAAFDKIDDTGRGWVEEGQFEALMEAVGTTYSVENHKRKLVSICSENHLEREVFLAWYDDWLFGEDDSSEEGSEEGKEINVAAKTEGFSSLLVSQASGWKCRACLVSNPESATECLSCETLKPGEEGKVGESAAGSTPSSACGVFGPSFGSNKAISGFKFGSPPVPANATTSTAESSGSNASGGFTFGGPPAGASVSVVAAAKSTAGGFRFGAPVAAASSLVAAPAGGADEDSKAVAQSSSEGSDDGGGDGDDDDDDEDAERQEERAKAEAAFDEVDGDGKGWVEEAQFEALMEAVGTTYSAEDHKPKLLSVCRENRLEREVFLTWYDDWLFGEDDSSDGGGEKGKEVSAIAKTESFSSLLARQADGWKCRACLVSNPKSTVKCLSCETAKSGEEGKVADSATRSGTSSPGSALALSFGSSEVTGNFTFGSPSVPASVTTSSQVSSGSHASGGFTFGGPPACAAVAIVPVTEPTAGGFRFGVPVAASTLVAPASTTTAPVVHPPTPAGGADEDSRAVAQSSGDGNGNDDGSDDGNADDDVDDDVDDGERQEERAKAEAAFDEVDGDGKGWVEEAQFEALMEAVGTTYSVEDHKPKLLSVCRENHLEREAFLTWYDDWLFGEDDSSDGGGDEKISAVAKTEGFSSLLARQADGWKCRACLVSNPESAVKCLSCETAKSGEEGKEADSATRSGTSSPGSAFALSFGSSKVTGNFTFGSPPVPASTTSSQVSSGSNASGGFTFGGPPACAAMPVVTATEPTAGGFRFGAPVASSALVAPASTTTAAVAHPPAPAGGGVGKESRAAAQSSGGGNENGSDDGSDDGDADDDVDDGERQEERAKAEAAFDEVDSGGKGWVEEAQFEALMEAVGTTYSVEDHKPKLLSVCRENHLEREVFLTWYDDWLFGEDDSSDGGGDEEKEMSAAAKTEGFSSLLASQADGWKCRACLVFNPESTVKCLSCETVKSGEDRVPESSAISSDSPSHNSSTGVSSLSASSSARGFTFGTTPLTAPDSHAPPSGLGSGTTTSGVSPFGFAVPQAEATAPSPAKVPPSYEPGTSGAPPAANIGATVGVEENAKENNGDSSLPILNLSQPTGSVFAIRSPPSTSGGRFSFGLPTGVLSCPRAASSERHNDGGGTGDVGEEAESSAAAGDVPLGASMPLPPRIVTTAAANSNETSSWAEALISPRGLENLTPRSRAWRLAASGRGSKGRRGSTPTGNRKK